MRNSVTFWVYSGSEADAVEKVEVEESSKEAEQQQQPDSEEVISEQPAAPATGKHKSHYTNYTFFSPPLNS